MTVVIFLFPTFSPLLSTVIDVLWLLRNSRSTSREPAKLLSDARERSDASAAPNRIKSSSTTHRGAAVWKEFFQHASQKSQVNRTGVGINECWASFFRSHQPYTISRLARLQGRKGPGFPVCGGRVKHSVELIFLLGWSETSCALVVYQSVL